MNPLKSIKILIETNVIYLQSKPSIFVHISKDFTLEIFTRQLWQPVLSVAVLCTGA